MSATLNELVRCLILMEGPQIADGYDTQAAVDAARDEYVEGVLNAMNNVELLERISNAIESRLGWTE